MFRLIEKKVAFHEWLRNSASGAHRNPYGPSARLERPFRERPFGHRHYNHGNTDERIKYCFVVGECSRGSDGPETCILGLFIPSGVSKTKVVRHLRYILQMAADLTDVKVPYADEACEHMAA